MENKETTLFNWARAQELMDNIKRMNDLLQVHYQANSSDLITFQYEELRGRFIRELNEMFQVYALVVKSKPKRRKKKLA